MATPAVLPAQGVAVVGRAPAARRPLPEGRTPPAVRFRDVAAEAGLVAVNVSGERSEKTLILETTGNGVAIVDYDGDGLQDILLVNGGRLGSSDWPGHALYRNRGGLRFEDVTQAAGLEQTGWGQGVCVGDVNGDGRPDIYIAQWGADALDVQGADGRFREESAARGLADPEGRWSAGCAFLDHDRDGDLDLFVARYVNLSPDKTPARRGRRMPLDGIAGAVRSARLPGESMALYENVGGGRFRDISAASGVATPRQYYGFTPLTGDFDGDGWTDVYVTCDSTASLFFHNQRDGTFAEVGLVSGAAYNADGMEQAGMGATAADYDGDGDLDIFVTNFSQDAHTLYRNDGEMFFVDHTTAAGLGVNTSYVGWGAAFLDFDHDGWKDLLVVNGHVYPGLEKAKASERFEQPRLLYWNRGDGEFHDLSAEAGPGVAARHSSRGMAVGDLDNDGRLEVVVVNMHEAPSLLVNEAPAAGGALLVEPLRSGGSAAIGARVTVRAGGRTQIEEIRSGGFHISQGDLRAHFGLGSLSAAEVSIRWPDGATTEIGEVGANQWIVVRQGKGIERTVQLEPARRP